jgi:Spy/CpxP family protein refolding chaperone
VHPADPAVERTMMAKRTVARLQLAFFLSILALGALTLWISTARAESGDRPPIVVPVLIGDGPGLLIPAILQATELTDEQGAIVTQVLEKEVPRMRDLFNALRQANLALAAKSLGATNPRQAEIAPLLRQISDLRRRLAELEMTTLLRIRAVLKPEQLAHLEKVTQSVMQDLRGLAARPEGATTTE